jgi:hypothetical protein
VTRTWDDIGRVVQLSLQGSAILTFELLVDESDQTILYHFDDMFQGVGLEESKSKACFGLEVKRLVDDVFQGMGLEDSKSKGVLWLRGGSGK